jgi:FkbM family methyltransferase
MPATPAAVPPTQPLREVTVAGVRFRVCDDKPTFWDRAEAGTWEPATLAALVRLTGPDTTLLDIGAWVGPLTMVAAARGSRVVAVEADPRALALLEGNIRANPELSDRITVVPRAASARGDSVRMGAPRKPGDSMSSVLRGQSPGSWKARGIGPTELLELAQSRGEGALVVKIDIEGGEYNLVPALARQLPARTRAVLLALHPRELLASGRTRGEVASATQACRTALSGWSATLLDSDPHGARTDPFEVAGQSDVTLLIERSATSVD